MSAAGMSARDLVIALALIVAKSDPRQAAKLLAGTGEESWLIRRITGVTA